MSPAIFSTGEAKVLALTRPTLPRSFQPRLAL